MNNDKLLSMWETSLWSHMFKLYTLKRLTDDIKIVFHFSRGVDLMTEEEGLFRHNNEGEQVGNKMTEIGEYQKQGKMENMRKKKNVGGEAEEEKEDEDEQNMSPWIKNMLRRMGQERCQCVQEELERSLNAINFGRPINLREGFGYQIG